MGVRVLRLTIACSNVYLDIHLGNILLQQPSDIQLSDEQLYEKYGQPRKELVVRLDGQQPGLGVPTHAIEPTWLGALREELKLSEAKILLTDFGEAFKPQEATCESNAPVWIRPPESRFERRPLSFSSDVWLLAYAIWSILCQRSLFQSWFPDDDTNIRRCVETLGILPTEWWCQWEARKKWFDNNGTPLEQTNVKTLEDHFEFDTQAPRRREKIPLFEQDEKDAILVLLRSMLSYKPEDRITAAEILESKWVKNWAMPEFEKIQQDYGSRDS